MSGILSRRRPDPEDSMASPLAGGGESIRRRSWTAGLHELRAHLTGLCRVHQRSVADALSQWTLVTQQELCAWVRDTREVAILLHPIAAAAKERAAHREDDGWSTVGEEVSSSGPPSAPGFGSESGSGQRRFSTSMRRKEARTPQSPRSMQPPHPPPGGRPSRASRSHRVQSARLQCPVQGEDLAESFRSLQTSQRVTSPPNRRPSGSLHGGGNRLFTVDPRDTAESSPSASTGSHATGNSLREVLQGLGIKDGRGRPRTQRPSQRAAAQTPPLGQAQNSTVLMGSSLRDTSPRMAFEEGSLAFAKMDGSQMTLFHAEPQNVVGGSGASAGSARGAAFPSPAERSPSCLESSAFVVSQLQRKRSAGLGSMATPSSPTTQSIIDKSIFGIELETFVVKDTSELALGLPQKVREDFCPQLHSLVPQCGFHFLDYDVSKKDTVFNNWKVTTDSSIQSEDGKPIFAFEVVSAKLSGWSGLDLARLVTNAMRDYGCVTNRSTGLHVHVSCADLSNNDVKRLFMNYVAFEHIIDDFHSYPRRKDHSKYCRSIALSIASPDGSGLPAHAPPTDIAALALAKLRHLDVSYAQGLTEMVRMVNPRLGPRASSGRNHKINVHYIRGSQQGDEWRRIEWRQHAGSVDPEEVVMWARFCTLFTGRAAAMQEPSGPGTEQQLWAALRDDTLQRYYSVKKATLPAEPKFYTGVPRDSAEARETEGFSAGAPATTRAAATFVADDALIRAMNPLSLGSAAGGRSRPLNPSGSTLVNMVVRGGLPLTVGGRKIKHPPPVADPAVPAKVLQSPQQPPTAQPPPAR
eukprot:TRINITY_DN14130_c0_g1_i1.p1 TRINITY_DN14130_c0_g1~~TRINITY_DN14130_c0_g1_i1.p1  ORF type:complete len:808 (+),score=119.94 TRINITY_DN14130_c0_g1_i1:94-2517(+)